MRLVYIVIVLSQCFLQNVRCANILYLAPVLSKSHHIWNKALAYGLIEKGHRVTMVTDDEENKFPGNYSQIILEDADRKLHEEFDYGEFDSCNSFQAIHILYKWIYTLCKIDLETNGAKALVKAAKNHKYDLMVFDISVGHCFYPMIDLFKVPVVAVTPYLLPVTVSYAFGNHIFPSYVPYLNTKHTDRMDFVERTFNFIYTYAEILYANYVYRAHQQKLLQTFFGSNVRAVGETEKDLSLLLANTDPILDYPMALPPNIITVGGLHAKPSKPLPEDIQKIMDNSKKGVILFSLGTNIRSDSLSTDKRNAILSAFAHFPHTILWKFESDLDGLPKNVIIRKWLPQNDMLGHPNLKLFVNHGGALSTQEAMYHGIPIVGIPFFGDQHTNMLKIVHRKLGVLLNSEKLTTNSIVEAFTAALKPEYRTNMQTISRMYRDQPQTALEKAIFWVEYVHRNGNTQRLSPASRYMLGYQTRSLDVIGFLLLLICLVMYLLYYAIAWLRMALSTKMKTKTN